MLEAKLIAKTSIPEYKDRGRPSSSDETPIQELKDPDMYFTAGQIFKNHLMLTFKGTPQKCRMKVDAVVKKIATHRVETPWGMVRAISTKQLNDFNSRMVRITEARLAYDDFLEHGEIRYYPRILATLAPLTEIKNLSTTTPQPTLDQTVVEVSQE